MDEKRIIQKIVLGAVVLDNDRRVLILQRNADEDVFPNLWELPSGKRETFESSNDSLLREVKEETNLAVKVLMPISVFDYKIEKPDEVRDSTQINFLVKAEVPENLKLSDEHQNFAWVTESEMKNYKVSEETKKVIEKGFGLVNKLSL